MQLRHSRTSQIAAKALHLFRHGILPEIQTEPVQASLWAAAAACITYSTGDWWESSIIACGDTFAVIDSYLFNDDAAENMDPEAAAFLLLLVREAEGAASTLH